MATSSPYRAWDVVIVPFPYADRLAEKRRPALVVSTHALNAHGLLWVAMLGLFMGVMGYIWFMKTKKIFADVI